MYEYNKKVCACLDEETLFKAARFSYTYAVCFVSYYANLDRIETREDLAQSIEWYRRNIVGFIMTFMGGKTAADEYVSSVIDESLGEVDRDLAEEEIWKAICKAKGGE